MPRDFATKLSALGVIPKRLFNVTGSYLFFLTLRYRRHSLQAASVVGQLDQSRFSSLLNLDGAVEIARRLFFKLRGEAVQGALSRASGRLVFIIDTTFQQRQSQALENIHRYHTGTRFITAHKFVNAVVLTPEGAIPLQTMPVYTKNYCRKYRLAYVSEFELAARFIDSLQSSGIFSKQQLESAVFLLDAGFDTKRIQKAIRTLGAHFVVAIKNSRGVSGHSVKEYFRRHRHLKWSTIRIYSGSGENRHRRTYSFRTATGVNLKGVGPATVIWSKAHGHARKPKYLAASDLTMTPREIIQWYAKRWTIELWHREMKQGFGYIDCHCRRFCAVEAHILLTLCAYLLQKLSGKVQSTLEHYLRSRDLNQLRIELTRFGGVKRLKTLVCAALARLGQLNAAPTLVLRG